MARFHNFYAFVKGALGAWPHKKLNRDCISVFYFTEKKSSLDMFKKLVNGAKANLFGSVDNSSVAFLFFTTGPGTGFSLFMFSGV